MSERSRFAAGSIVAVAVLWVVATSLTHLVSPGRFPDPVSVFAAAAQIGAGQGYAGGTIWRHIGSSVSLVLLGFAVAAATGVPLGLAMGSSRRIEAFVNPAFLLVRPIPPLAWIPLAIVWFGLGSTAKIFVVWFAAFVPALINTYTGVRNIDPTLVAAARVHGANSAQVLRHVIVPGSLPMIFGGLRLSLQASWTTLVAAELVGAVYGLGHVLTVASIDIYPGMIFYAMVWVAILGAAMTSALAWLERSAAPWLR